MGVVGCRGRWQYQRNHRDKAGGICDDSLPGLQDQTSHYSLLGIFRGGGAKTNVAVVRVSRGFDVRYPLARKQKCLLHPCRNANRRQPPKSLADFSSKRGNFRVELRPVSGATLADLDRRRLKNYFAHVRQQDVPADDDETGWQTLLFNTEIMVEDGITVSGILLFGRNPNRFLPQAGIDATAFSGNNKDYRPASVVYCAAHDSASR